MSNYIERARKWLEKTPDNMEFPRDYYRQAVLAFAKSLDEEREIQEFVDAKPQPVSKECEHKYSVEKRVGTVNTYYWVCLRCGQESQSFPPSTTPKAPKVEPVEEVRGLWLDGGNGVNDSLVKLRDKLNECIRAINALERIANERK